MKLSDIITTRKMTEYSPMGLGKQHYWEASCLGQTARGRTKQEAIDSAVANVKNTVSAIQDPPIARFAADGTVFVLSYFPESWGYQIFKRGGRHPACLTLISAKTRSEALEQMMSHIQSYS